MKKSDLKIRLNNGKYINYKVEIPETNEEYSKGLAYRKSLGKNSGMLYNYANTIYFGSYPNKIGMFTPQTEIPVDFIFADNVGTIIKITHNAKPLSKKLSECYCTGFVLEVNAGDCKKNNINIGDIIMFKDEYLKDIFQALNINNAEYSKMHTDIYCNKNDDLYMYSYKSHKWLNVDENDKSKFQEHMDIISKFIKLEKISKEEANTLAINTDKLLLEDLKKTKRKFYWAAKTLFLEYNYEKNEVKYYDYKNGWTQVYWNDFPHAFFEMKWRVLTITSDEVKEKINLIEKEYSVNKLQKENISNADIIKKLIKTEYPVSTILYKTSDVPGWNIAKIPGYKKQCIAKCIEYVNKKRWFDYKYYMQTIWACETRYNEFKAYYDNNYRDIHEYTNLIYMPSMRRYFLNNEIIPYPQKITKCTDDFNIKVIFNPDNDDLWDTDVYDFPTTDISIKIQTDTKNATIFFIAEDVLKNLKQFIRKIKTSDFAVYSNDEYTSAKILAWRNNKKIRIMVQHYGDKLKKQIDTEVPEKIFIEKFNEAISEIKEFIRLNNDIWNDKNGNAQPGVKE